MLFETKKKEMMKFRFVHARIFGFMLNNDLYVLLLLLQKMSERKKKWTKS